MSDMPFIQYVLPDGRVEPDALFGFTLPHVPSAQEVNASGQLSLVKSLWNSPITTLELRFIIQPDHTTTIHVLCRIHRSQSMNQKAFRDLCAASALQIERLYRDCGYHLQAIPTEAALAQVLTPFQVQALAEIRRPEEVAVFSDAFTEYEFYVTYAWEWATDEPLAAFAALQQLHSPALVSISLEPTRLSPPEQMRLTRATSGDTRNLLWEGGTRGENIYQQYQLYTQRLQKPYLMRICLAGPNQHTIHRLGQAILAQTRVSGPAPVLQFPQEAREWQTALRSLRSLEWLSWGNICEDIPEAMRLRYLVDSQGASTNFSLPVLPEYKAQKIAVLIIFANPYYDIAGKQLRLDANDRTIREAIQRAAHRDNISLTIHHATTIDDLRRALLEQNFRIVHIAGHGSKGRDGVQRLVLSDERGAPYYVPPEALASLFAAYSNTLECVVLNACNSLTQGELIAKTIPYTIAMEGELSDNAALEFSKGFYDALGADKTIEFAYQEGCRCVNFMATDRQFMPKIFVKSHVRS